MAEIENTIANLISENNRLRAENERLQAALDAAEERVKYLVAWRDAFSKDWLRGYKEQIEKNHGIYRCDICKHGSENTLKHTCYCSKHKCDGYSHWKWRGFNPPKDEVQNDNSNTD